MGWMRWVMAVWLGGCVAEGRDGEDDAAQDSTGGEESTSADESTGPDAEPDPRVVFDSASYDFDSGCTPYESASVRVTVTAIDAPITTVTLGSYQIHGYMSGVDLTPATQDPEDALPLAIGESVELRFRQSHDGWAGECADWEPPEADVLVDAVVSLDGDPVELHGTASVGCGWTEC